MEEHQKELSKILGLSANLNRTMGTWAEIYVELGKLKERAENILNEYRYPNNPSPLTSSYDTLAKTDAPYHYHDGIKCYQNPCNWR